MRNFRDLDVWNISVDFSKKIYSFLNYFPSSEKFGLSSQISRSVVSIPSNIAEGCSRNTQKDFSRFLQISLGSSFELETQLIIANKINYISDADFSEIITELHLIQKKIQSLKNYADSLTVKEF